MAPDFYTWCHFVFDASLFDRPGRWPQIFIHGTILSLTRHFLIAYMVGEVAPDFYTWCHFAFDASLFDPVNANAKVLVSILACVNLRLRRRFLILIRF